MTFYNELPIMLKVAVETNLIQHFCACLEWLWKGVKSLSGSWYPCRYYSFPLLSYRREAFPVQSECSVFPLLVQTWTGSNAKLDNSYTLAECIARFSSHLGLQQARCWQTTMWYKYASCLWISRERKASFLRGKKSLWYIRL
jgi:hypothetical protein